MLDKLLSWYWDYGIRRGTDPNDPDRELRKITIGGWLDPLVRLLERRQDIQDQDDAKACLAVWGPSQSGKSTMISHFVDGQDPGGADSALTWSASHRTRFSPPEAGQDAMDGALCFNPWNHKSDASGIATRYTLHAESEQRVDPNFPVEVKLSNRTQLILSVSLGYLSECDREEENINYTREKFLGDLQELNAKAGEVSPASYSQEAYLLLHDMANAIEFMRGHDRFSNLFRRDEWERTLRKALVSSPAMLADVKCAEQFLTQLFWDGSSRVTRFYRSLLDTLNQLQSAWRGCRILTTMEVGSLLLDIDSFSSFVSRDGRIETKKKVERLSTVQQNGTVCISVGDDMSDDRIAGTAFGNFQAICAELIVPLRRESIEQAQDKRQFLELLETCDFLDFPGVSNKNKGNATGDGNATLIQLQDSTPDSELLTSVFKQGKTQCFVNNYVRKYGIDAFAILVRTDSPSISNSSLLNAGIKEWLCSFEPSWQPGNRPPMPVFLNMTFFSSLLNDVSRSGTGKNGLVPYVMRLQELNFVRPDCTRIFATTYQQFHDGKIENPGNRNNTIRHILEDPTFSKETGLTNTDLQAVYEQDGGLGYMFSSISHDISVRRRQQECLAIARQDQKEMERLMESQLPGQDDGNSRQRQLNDFLEHLRDLLWRIENEDDSLDDSQRYDRLAFRLNALFSISYETLDPLPLDIEHLSQKQIRKYLKEQLVRWYEDRTARLESNECLTAEQSQVVLICLREAIEQKQLLQFLNEHYGQLHSQREADEARRSLALALGNCLRTGTVCQSNLQIDVGGKAPASLETFIEAKLQKSMERTGSPYYRMVIEPLMRRLEKLAEDTPVGSRPPQPGDDELQQLLDSLLQRKAGQSL